MLYRKPVITNYSVENIVEEIGPLQNSYSVTLYCTPDQNVATGDGSIYENGEYTTNYNYVGSGWDPQRIYRSFMGFDISSLSGKTVVSATLRIYQDSANADGYTYLGDVIAERFDFGSSIDVSDWSAAALSSIGSISTNATEGVWKTLDVASTVQSDINDGHTVSQFRIKHENDTIGGGNRFENFVKSNSDDSAGTGHGPQLVVTYD